MFLISLFFVLFTPLSSQGSDLLKSQRFLVAEKEITAFDPFIDYGEFQDNVTEQESINFFQKGRSLNINVLLGYEAITFNMRQIYGDSPGVIGVSIGFFFDLNFALHIGGLFPHSHYNSILSITDLFSTMNLDFKYYFNKQKLTKSVAEFLNPYIIFGPFWFKITNPNIKDVSNKQNIPTNLPGATPQSNVRQPPSTLNNTDISTLSDFTSIGFKLGVGVEVPFIKKTYLGFEMAYLYTNLQNENTDLSNIKITPNIPTNKTFFDRLIYPDTPEVKGYRFYGDTITTLLIFGVNF